MAFEDSESKILSVAFFYWIATYEACLIWFNLQRKGMVNCSRCYTYEMDIEDMDNQFLPLSAVSSWKACLNTFLCYGNYCYTHRYSFGRDSEENDQRKNKDMEQCTSIYV